MAPLLSCSRRSRFSQERFVFTDSGEEFKVVTHAIALRLKFSQLLQGHLKPRLELCLDFRSGLIELRLPHPALDFHLLNLACVRCEGGLEIAHQDGRLLRLGARSLRHICGGRILLLVFVLVVFRQRAADRAAARLHLAKAKSHFRDCLEPAQVRRVLFFQKLETLLKLGQDIGARFNLAD